MPKQPSSSPKAAQAALFTERRKHQRHRVTLFVRLRRIDPHDLSEWQQEYRTAVCRNISDGGMLLEIDGHVPRGQMLEVYATDRGSNSTIFGIVETVRAVRSPDRYEVGVRFLRREEV